MTQPKERREGREARLLRLQNTLMEIYADPSNVESWHRVKFDKEFGLLCQKWRAVRPKGVRGHQAEREASSSYRDYRNALLRVVGQRLGLADEYGNPLPWALRWVDVRVSAAVSHRFPLGGRGLPGPLAIYPSFMERAYRGLEGFTLFMVPGYLQLKTPDRHDEVELEFGDEGLGPDEWKRLGDLAHRAVDVGIEEVKARFEAVVSESGSAIRPSSIEKDRQALLMLHQHLAMAIEFDQSRVKNERAKSIARSLGIQYPRRPMRS